MFDKSENIILVVYYNTIIKSNFSSSLELKIISVFKIWEECNYIHLNYKIHFNRQKYFTQTLNQRFSIRVLQTRIEVTVTLFKI